MNARELIATAKTLVAGDKGLLAMDESNPTCNKRSARLGIPRTETLRAYSEFKRRLDVLTNARRFHNQVSIKNRE